MLLHGLGATGDVWNAWWPLLARRWPGRWLAPDLPGHGGSPPLAAYTGSLLALLAVQAVTFALAGLYIPRRDLSLLDALGTLAQATTIANVVALAVGAFWRF